MGKEGFLKPTEGQQICHRRTCSDTSFHLEENPSWLEDLLDDTEEVPVRKGHRRSVSFTHANLDGEAYKDLAKEAHNNSVPSWASLDYDQSHEQLTGGLISKNPKSSNSFLSGSPSLKDGIGLQSLKGSSGTIQKADHTVKLDGIPSKPTPPLNPDTKRAKQQANHRPRIRKLQYIAELERHVQFLQIEGLQVTAELEFLDQHNLILVMENRALKHQLDSISQVQHIKCLEQDMLEREIARLRNLYQHQQLQQQKLKQSTRRASKNRDLDFQFAHMSIKHNGIGSL